ncbi:MAG: hypothetical protein MI919_12905, partial [Holophagales bacterium]|nr:hypothetical protein [Holophagales bacterium]
MGRFFAALTLLCSISAPALGQIWDGVPPGSVPQDAADLDRTADAVFGFALTPEQRDITRKWRVKDIGWWMETDRETRALDVLGEIYRVSGIHRDRALETH